MPGPVRERYEAMAASGAIAPDDEQRALANRLDALAATLRTTPRPAPRGALGWLSARRNRTPPRRGLYIWGEVGRGKTLLMDLFFEAAPIAAKRRAHFHAFMGDVHDRLNRARRKTRHADRSDGRDPIVRVADEIAAEIALLCFDEFAVYDIADAMILGRLFGALFERGVVVVATTNVAPDELYKDGLNRALFLPFIALIKERMTVFHLDAPRDYRLDASGTERRYVTPLGVEADACLDAHFRFLSGGAKAERVELRHKGHAIPVPLAAGGVARFAFEDLCGRPLGPGDYLTIAEHFGTLIVGDIPILSAARRNEAKRLIALIDTLYDRRVRLIASAAAEPHVLWEGKDGAETFEFQRTASRLIEMRSDSYWHESREPSSKATAQTKKAQAIGPGPSE